MTTQTNLAIFFIEILPLELLHHIQSFIYDEWRNLRLVCKEWSKVNYYQLSDGYLKLKIQVTNLGAANTYKENHEYIVKIKEMCKSKFLENVYELKLRKITTPILECIFACKYFKNLKRLDISGAFKCKVFEKLISKSISIIDNLKYLEVYHKNNDEKLIEIVRKCAKETNKPILYYTVYICNGDRECLYKSAELNFITAIQKIYLDFSECIDSHELEKWLLKGSELGDFYSQLQLAKYYIEKFDHSNAMKWFLQFVKFNRKNISYNATQFGLEFYKKKEMGKAMEWFTISSERNDPKGQYFLAACYESLKDYRNAFKWYLKSAKHDSNHNGQVMVGECYEKGTGIKSDINKAFEWYLKSAQGGNEKGQHNLGLCYKEGKGTEIDERKALEWLLKAAENGRAQYQNSVGACYHSLENAKQEDLRNGFEWFLKAAEQGCIQAQSNVGWCYQQGTGIEQNFTKSFEWYLKAAEQGFSDAQHDVGICYKEGRGTELNLNKAFEWFLKAAEKNNIDSQHQVIYMYCNGIGIQPNMHEALKWLMKTSNGSNKISATIVEFLRSFGLLNHLQVEMNDETNSNYSDKMINDFISTIDCDICSEHCFGFYYTTSHDHEFGVCMKCWNKDDINERLMEFKSEIGELTFFKDHLLKGFLPLIEYCKQENQINNPQLDSIILQLKVECHSENQRTNSF